MRRAAGEGCRACAGASRCPVHGRKLGACRTFLKRVTCVSAYTLAGKLLMPSGSFRWNGAALSGGAISSASVINTGPSTPCRLLLLLLPALLLFAPLLLLEVPAIGPLPLNDLM